MRLFSLRRMQYEQHYETSHRNRCSTCGRSFPTNRLLDLHLSEEHDSFFKAMAERRPMYTCLVEGCTEVFETSGERHTHLVGAHRYPERFDFSRYDCTRVCENYQERWLRSLDRYYRFCSSVWSLGPVKHVNCCMIQKWNVPAHGHEFSNRRE